MWPQHLCELGGQLRGEPSLAVGFLGGEDEDPKRVWARMKHEMLERLPGELEKRGLG